MATDKAAVPVDAEKPPRFFPSSRFTLALLVFFAFIVQYSQRVNLPIAIVCMVNRTKTPIKIDSNLAKTDALQDQFAFNRTIATPTAAAIQKGGIFEEKQFFWNEFQQQLLLGGYWGGYIFTQVPGKRS